MTRFIVLAILFYILYRLLFAKKPRQQTAREQGRVQSSSEAAAQDVLVEDPVCHVYIPQGQAVSCTHQGQNFYFCSDKCRTTFLSQQDTFQ